MAKRSRPEEQQLTCWICDKTVLKKNWAAHCISNVHIKKARHRSLLANIDEVAPANRECEPVEVESVILADSGDDSELEDGGAQTSSPSSSEAAEGDDDLELNGDHTQSPPVDVDEEDSPPISMENILLRKWMVKQMGIPFSGTEDTCSRCQFRVLLN